MRLRSDYRQGSVTSGKAEGEKGGMAVETGWEQGSGSKKKVTQVSDTMEEDQD